MAPTRLRTLDLPKFIQLAVIGLDPANPDRMVDCRVVPANEPFVVTHNCERDFVLRVQQVRGTTKRFQRWVRKRWLLWLKNKRATESRRPQGGCTVQAKTGRPKHQVVSYRETVPGRAERVHRRHLNRPPPVRVFRYPDRLDHELGLAIHGGERWRGRRYGFVSRYRWVRPGDRDSRHFYDGRHVRKERERRVKVAERRAADEEVRRQQREIAQRTRRYYGSTDPPKWVLFLAALFV